MTCYWTMSSLQKLRRAKSRSLKPLLDLQIAFIRRDRMAFFERNVAPWDPRPSQIHTRPISHHHPNSFRDCLYPGLRRKLLGLGYRHTRRNLSRSLLQKKRRRASWIALRMATNRRMIFQLTSHGPENRLLHPSLFLLQLAECRRHLLEAAAILESRLRPHPQLPLQLRMFQLLPKTSTRNFL